MKTKENGRSMIEMLGVLAIIGVLSVGGIYGYSAAMRKRKANEIVHVANMLATQARSADGGRGECLSLSEAGFDTKPAGVEVEMKANPEPIGSPVTVNIQIKEDLSEDELDELCKSITSMSTSELVINQCDKVAVECV